ncbi:MAG TPA: ABC transporter substrate-binding protein [Magnetospirillum sp.]|nr:ABC transporter substrate-binding protein [Magnetospirillum sp.]
MSRVVKALTAAALVSTVAVTAHAEPLSIAINEALSGVNNGTGHPYKVATNYVLDKFNNAGGLGGEKIALKVYDNGGNPANAATKTKQAIAEGARVIIQGSSSAVAAAIADTVNEYNAANPGKEVIYFNVGSTAMNITGDKCSYYTFRYVQTAPTQVAALVQAMKDDGKLGTRVFAVNQNYSWGQDVEAAIKANAAAGGYQVIDSILHEVNRIQDFNPIVAKIGAAKPDTVITGNWSNDLLLLMKAAGEANLKVRFGTTFLDQDGNVSNAGSVVEGNYVAHPYNAALTDGTWANDYKQATGRFPVYVEPPAARGAELLLKALKEAQPKGGFDANKVVQAIENTVLETDLGKVYVRKEDHQIMTPVVVSRAEKGAKYPVDGTDIGFTPVKMFPAGQFAYPVQASCHMKRPS